MFFRGEALVWELAHPLWKQTASSRTIYDIGMHLGEDTWFYIKKGFDVVAIEANPLLVRRAQKRFAVAVASGRLVIVHAAIAREDTGHTSFFINQRLSEWSSCSHDLAARAGDPCSVIEIPSRTLGSLLNKYGAPYYVKIDIEGHDLIALRSLLGTMFRPAYVSVENGNRGMLRMLSNAGYDRFQYIQQMQIPRFRLPRKQQEGLSVRHYFPPGSSGVFGEDLPGPWLTYAEVEERISAVWDPDGDAKNPRHIDSINGWFDLHARLGSHAIREFT